MSDRRLWLIRHAKAKATGATDHERELSRRGYRQCVEMGRFLETLDFPPAIFLASDARRTQTTAHVLSAFVAGKVSTFRAMYTFGVDSLWRAVGDVILSGNLDTEHSVAVVGHNSAVSDLGVELACDHDAGSLPTLGMVELTFAGDWDALLRGERVSLARRLEPQA